MNYTLAKEDSHVDVKKVRTIFCFILAGLVFLAWLMPSEKLWWVTMAASMVLGIGFNQLDTSLAEKENDILPGLKPGVSFYCTIRDEA